MLWSRNKRARAHSQNARQNDLRFATANNIIIIYTWTSVVATNVLLYTLQHDKRLFNIVFANDVQLQSFFQLNFFIFNKTNATLFCVFFLEKVTQFPM